ncbi:A24 family peptidase [Streptomyces sp. NBC_00829]|uniref:prepilin peptidase n=1 Tax=Streptomyces sp. NBC_00829 TaxID=2903679 RepID=UPI002F91AED8|nr:A24 family peptidase [Streptomyces sp. NBC_00829]
MSVLGVALSAAVGALAGAAARPLVFSRSVQAPAASRSSCPHCGSVLLGRRLLPLQPVSGRCPACKEHIGPPAVSAEVTTAAAFAAIAAGGASGWFAAAQYWLAACGIAMALIDLAVQRLPDVLTLPACTGTILLLAAATVVGEPGSLGRAAAGGAVLTAVFLLLAMIAGLGLGDVKLAPAIGALLGWSSWTHLWWGTAAGFLVGAVCAAALLTTGHDRRSQIAFGPFITIGALAVSLTTT